MTPFASGAASAWDAALHDLAAPHLLQCAACGEIKSRWGWSVHRFVWRDDAGVQAAAQVLVRRFGRLPIGFGYVPRGPLVASVEDAWTWRRVLADLAGWARRAGLVTLKIDADVPRSAVAVADAWRSMGWQPSATPVQFRNTMLSDLTPTEDALLATMHPKTRYNIGLAERRGVSVRHAGAEALDTFHALYVVTAARAGFATRSHAYYEDVWRTFLQCHRASVILAERDGRALAGVVPVTFGRRAWFLYGASGTDGREHMPAYLAQWESLRWARAQGCRTYDWWGAPDAPSETDPLWGVYRFKLGFGACWVDQMGAWDLPVRRAAHRALERFDLWRRRRAATQGPSASM